MPRPNKCTCAGIAPGYPQHEHWCGRPEVLLGTDPGVPDPVPTCVCGHIPEDHTEDDDGIVGCDHVGCPCISFIEADR